LLRCSDTKGLCVAKSLFCDSLLILWGFVNPPHNEKDTQYKWVPFSYVRNSFGGLSCIQYSKFSTCTGENFYAVFKVFLASIARVVRFRIARCSAFLIVAVGLGVVSRKFCGRVGDKLALDIFLGSNTEVSAQKNDREAEREPAAQCAYGALSSPTAGKPCFHCSKGFVAPLARNRGAAEGRICPLPLWFPPQGETLPPLPIKMRSGWCTVSFASCDVSCRGALALRFVRQDAGVLFTCFAR